MASKIIWPQIVGAKRQMSQLAALKRSADLSKSLNVEKSLLPSGLRVISLDSDAAAVSTVGVLVKSGSCYENYENLGISHALRLCAGLASKNATSFGIVRNVQQAGGNIKVVAGREYTLYLLSSPRNTVEGNFDFLNEIVTGPSFKPWEVKDQVVTRMNMDLAAMSPGLKAVELLHKAAYRQGLGNPLFAPQYMVGRHNPESLMDFHTKTHTVTRSIIVGNGVDHVTLSRMGRGMNFEKGHGLSFAKKYYGGELRLDLGGNTTYVAIAAESATSGDAKEILTFQLLSKVLGTAPKIHRGKGAGKLSKAVESISGNKSVSGLHCGYSESSLTGAYIICDSGVAGQVASEVVACLKGLSVSEEELRAAKKALLVDFSEQMLNSEASVEVFGQSLFSGETVPAENTGILDMISVGDVQAAAKKLSGSKLSMSAVGNLGHLPYLDSL